MLTSTIKKPNALSDSISKPDANVSSITKPSLLSSIITKVFKYLGSLLYPSSTTYPSNTLYPGQGGVLYSGTETTIKKPIVKSSTIVKP